MSVSDVEASRPTDAVSVAIRLAAVMSGVAPMVKVSDPGIADVTAMSVNVSLVPSGRLKVNSIFSPGLGLVGRSTDTAAGAPAGPVRTAPDSVVLMPASLKPNGDTASSVTENEVGVTGAITSLPRPLAPTSAWRRSFTTCVRPARAPSPFITCSNVSTEG